MCEEESDDAEAVNKLLEINDSIHRTVERYKLMKAGNVSAANNIPKGTLGTTTGVSRNAANELSLIDFDPEPAQSSSTAPAQQASNGDLLSDNTAATKSSQQNSVEDDLLGLSLGGTPTGGISLGGSTLTDLFNATPQPTAQAQPPPPNSSIPASASMSNTSANVIPPAKPNYDAFASLSSALPRSKPATPIPGQQRPTQAAPAADPFASLVSSGSRPSSRPTTPSQHQNRASARPVSGSFHPSGLASSTAAPATADDSSDWDFVSSPPAAEEMQSALPQKSTFSAHDQGRLKVIFECMRQKNQGPPATAPIFVKASFTNQTASAITALNFQIAVEKAYTLQLQPQSGKDLPPGQLNAVTQNMLVSNVPAGKGTAVKIRFKASYNLAGMQQEETGMVTSLGIA